MNKHRWVVRMFLGFGFIFSACGPSQADLDATTTQIAAQVFASQTAAAPTLTHTPPPTSTPTSTNTPTPVPTLTPTATPSPSATPTEELTGVVISTTEDGWSRYQLIEEGIAISLPPEWASIDLTEGLVDEMLSAAEEANPALEQFYSSAALRNLLEAGIKFYALDTSVDSLYSTVPTSLNVLKNELLFDISFSTFVEISLQQLENLFGPDTNISQESIQMSGREAIFIRYETEATDYFGDPQELVYYQYLLLEGRTQYVVTIANVIAFDEANAPLFARIAQSFEILE